MGKGIETIAIKGRDLAILNILNKGEREQKGLPLLHCSMEERAEMNQIAQMTWRRCSKGNRAMFHGCSCSE
eukprot:scaffold115474_cov21-Tisochrysis_lutea.AAC.2